MELRIYSSNWLHNANVYGFLRALEWASTEAKNQAVKIEVDFHSILKDDGTVVIDDDLAEQLYETSTGFPRLANIWMGYSYYLGLLYKKDERNQAGDSLENVEFEEEIEKLHEERKNMLFGKDRAYQNLINVASSFEKYRNYINYIFGDPRERVSLKNGEKECLLCGRRFTPYEDMEEFHEFSARLFGELSSFGSFPNAFWNLQTDRYVCNVCVQMALFRHIVFNNDGDFFINAPSFKAIWYLNKIAEEYREMLIDYERVSPSKVLATAVLATSPKLLRILGTWARQNVEIIQYRKIRQQRKVKKFYLVDSLPPKMLDVFFDSRVAYLIKQLSKGEGNISNQERSEAEVEDLNHSKIFSMVLNGDIAGLTEEGYERLREEIVDEEQKDSSAVIELAIRLKEILKGVKVLVSPGRLKELGRMVKDMFKNTKYRLLELARLGRRSEVYHLLLRTYMAHGREFPEELNKVFSIQDEENFKLYMMAYISGMTESAGGEEE